MPGGRVPHGHDDDRRAPGPAAGLAGRRTPVGGGRRPGALRPLRPGLRRRRRDQDARDQRRHPHRPRGDRDHPVELDGGRDAGDGPVELRPRPPRRRLAHAAPVRALRRRPDALPLRPRRGGLLRRRRDGDDRPLPDGRGRPGRLAGAGAPDGRGRLEPGRQGVPRRPRRADPQRLQALRLGGDARRAVRPLRRRPGRDASDPVDRAGVEGAAQHQGAAARAVGALPAPPPAAAGVLRRPARPRAVGRQAPARARGRQHPHPPRRHDRGRRDARRLRRRGLGLPGLHRPAELRGQPRGARLVDRRRRGRRHAGARVGQHGHRLLLPRRPARHLRRPRADGGPGRGVAGGAGRTRRAVAASGPPSH